MPAPLIPPPMTTRSWPTAGHYSRVPRSLRKLLGRCLPSSVDRLLLAQLPNRGKLRGLHRKFGLKRCYFLLVPRAAHRVFRPLQGFAGLRLVEIRAPDCGVGEHGDDLGLYLEDAAGDEDQLFVAAASGDDPH